MKTRKKKVKIVLTIQEIPEDYVPLREFNKKNYSYLWTLTVTGKLRAVKWMQGKSGTCFVDRKQAEKLIKKKVAPTLPLESSPSNDATFTVILKEIQFLNEKFNAILKAQESERSMTTVNARLMDRVIDQVENLTRHVCIHGTLLFGIVEALGGEKEVFDKSTVKEKILKLNRLLTQEEWGAGFDL